MRRREFVIGLAAAASASGTAAGQFETTSTPERAASQVADLVFDSSCSLLDANGGELTDSSVVAVWLEETAGNHDDDGNGDATLYGDDTQVPVVAVDGNVVGFGGVLVEDGTNWQRGNEEFVLNVWDDHLGGSGTVLWDEGHGQYYDLSQFTEFEDYAESNGYTVTPTTSLASDLSGADGVVITSPSSSFTSSEKQALADFVATGGSVFLHDQSDYSDYDETANLNDVASSLGLAFRFNDDEVIDEVVNAGSDYEPLTDDFNTNFSYFADRDGLGLDPSKTYTVTVDAVTDGDTVDVIFDDGTTESVRVLGIDTPETSQNSEHERIQEWEGIEDETYLQNWADEATQFAKDEIGGKTVDLTFDANEPARDAFGRVLGYLWHDKSGDGSRDTLYNYQCVDQGYARIYGSSFSRHEQFWDGEAAARDNGTRVWQESDPENSTEIRDRDVDDVFFPWAASVRTDSGAIADSRVPVYAESTATQDLDGVAEQSSAAHRTTSGDGVSYADVPLVGVDDANGVAAVGSPLIDESYESEEGYAVDTSTYENFVFLTNLIDDLSSRTGDVLIDGGHDQFDASYALSNEDAAYYQRYLEGQGIGFEQVNSITTDNLSRGRALIVTTPPEAFTQSEVDAVTSFMSDGGAVILMGAGKVVPEARSNLNDLASAIDTDLRINEDQVLDDSNNVNSDPEVPDTTVFDTSFDLFSAYSSDGGSGGQIEVATTHPDAVGNDGDNLNDEYVVFENVGSEALDLTGWTVQDEASKTYQFPDGFSLDAGAQVTLHTGSGTDTSTDLYWGASSPVWNNGGDTVYVYDDQGNLATSHTYSDSNPTVFTDGATNVGDTTATLNGTLDDLGSASSADVSFEYREAGTSSWTATAAQTLSSTGSYSQDVSGLTSGTDYEFRAVADASDGQSDAGTTATFTTGSGDTSVAVSTDSATDVTDTSATLNGTLTDLGGASSADVSFEYRQVGASTWNATTAQTVSSTGSFSDSVSGLSSGTEYEFRAVADASDGDSDTGATVTFTTDSGGSTAPAIDSYTVTEAGSKNPHAEITADWAVSDADGDLGTVVVEVFDSTGTRVDSSSTNVGGSSASGTDQFKVKHGANETYDVTLTVTDAAGNSTSQTKSVTA